MSNWHRAFHQAAAAIRANLLPGLLLQCLLLIFFSAYVAHEGTRAFLGDIAHIKEEAGYLFSFVCYVASSALLPEILRIAFFQNGRPAWRNLRLFLTAAPAWGCLGMLVDLFYRCQAGWFGTGNDLMTILPKVAVDQLLYAPFLANPIAIAWFIWRDEGFRRSAWPKIFYSGFFMERVFSVQVSSWIVWVPGVALVYFMPPHLQIPVAVFVQTFWVLIFTTLGQGANGEREL
ncbi:MAG: hypothetical protein WCS31_02810 [Verrucomicrobiae bacterium]